MPVIFFFFLWLARVFAFSLTATTGVMTGVAEPPAKGADAKTFHDRYFGLSEEDFNKSLAVNTIGPYFLSAAFIPLLAASKVKARYNNRNIQPQIINTASMNGWTKVSSDSFFVDDEG